MSEAPTVETPEAAEAPAKPKRAVRTPGAVTAPEAAEAPAGEDPTAGLPNAIDIDARKITAPVLTKQGWVVPPDFGQPAKR
jgi:hypothetical protein